MRTPAVAFLEANSQISHRKRTELVCAGAHTCTLTSRGWPSIHWRGPALVLLLATAAYACNLRGSGTKFPWMRLMQSFAGRSSHAEPSDAAVRPAPGTADGRSWGGSSRDDGKVSYGYSLLRGKRQNMEDYVQAKFSKHPVTGEPVGFFGVFDGHGGPGAAAFVNENLLNTLLSHEKFDTDLKTALTESFATTDQQYLAADGNQNKDDGCTAVAAVLIGNRLVVANVGDSRAVLSRNSQAIPMSEDHKPNRADERQRIESAGGIVVWAGTWRVGGVLAVSRAFGDRLLKRYVVADPDILEEKLSSDDHLLILATDGLWDVVSNQDAIMMIRNIPDAEAAARKLTDEAFSRGSNDNISCIVVKFKYDAVDPGLVR